MIVRRLVLVASLLAPEIFAEFRTAPVLSVTRQAPLFEKPSSRSKLLAEADPDTPVLGRALSPQGSWILVEDSEGNRGWMPTERSNYKEVSELRDQVLPVDPSTKAEPNFETPDNELAMPEVPVAEGPRNWEISAGYREGINAGVTTVFPIGFAFFQSAPDQRVGLRVDMDLGASKTPYAWRISFLGRYPWVGSFFRELDIGYERQKSDPVRAGLSAGYSLGFGVSKRLSFSLRGGLFLGSERQWNGEFRCRFAF